MAITIDYSNPAQFIINIPKADTTLVTTTPSEVRQLNINDFRLTLNDIMDDAADVWAVTNHVHTPPLTISGVTLARVVEILDPYVIQFEDGSYSVNITGGNSNLSDVNIKNQVGLNTANSAGLQDPFALQAAAFEGEVAMSVLTGTSGTTFPQGTRAFPVDNVADAITIAQTRGLRTIRVLSNQTISSGDFSDGFTFVGDNFNVTLTMNPGANVTNCEFRNLTITGTLDGNNALRQCAIGTLTYVNGFVFQCGLSDVVTLGGTVTASFLQCYSLIAGGGPNAYPSIDMNGTQITPLVVRDWQGGLGIQNRSGGTADSSIDLSSGRIIFAASVTTGEFTVRGIGDVEDSSGGTAVVQDKTVNAAVNRTRKHQTNKLVTDPTTGVATLTDDDGVTPLETSQLYEDAAGTQTYRGQGAERREGFA
jgi:hypothetical protein